MENRMKLAISNIAWEAKDDANVLRNLGACGCTALEIAPTRIIPELPYQHLPEARAFANQVKQENGLPICSMQSIWYRRSECIFGSSQEVESLVEYTKEAILFAETIGCPNLVFGCPKNRIVPEGKQAEDAIEFFRTVGDFASAHGTVIALEAVPVSYGTNFLNQTQEAFDFAAKVGSEGLRINLDFGTMLVNGETVEDIARYVPMVNHVHISEDGLAGIAHRQTHQTFLRALREAGYSKYVSIEMRNQEDPEKVLNTVKYLWKLMQVYG